MPPLQGFWVEGGGGFEVPETPNHLSPALNTGGNKKFFVCSALWWNTQDSHKEWNPRRMVQTQVSTSYARCAHNPGGWGFLKGLVSRVKYCKA